ncbi:MAG TPA: Nramp family divalent metal transporter [Microbacteriaceae bacterium]|nr:Nramp family divalent metal transporter [Microbacteriaceae bacterium]
MNQRMVGLLGPALVAGVAYLDPGNVASNMTAGARYGYLLVWVVVLGNLMAWLVQYLSAKLGVVTGQSLPEALGARFRSPWTRRAYWLQAEAVAMATDIAEIIGGAIALWLLFGVPLVIGGAITGCVSLLMLSVRGARRFEIVISALIMIIVLGFITGLVVQPPSIAPAIDGLVPRFAGIDSVLLATSILGATIMPHAIYAHAGLSRDRHRTGSVPTSGAIDTLLRAQRWDVTVAMIIAGAVNLGLLLLAASALYGAAGTDSLEGAHANIAATLGPVVATLFAVGLLASGLASSAVGAYAGSEIMTGLIRRSIPMWLRRLVTMVPALALLALGVEPTSALVWSQVVLSFGIPFAIIPLVRLTSDAAVLGRWHNRPATRLLGWLAAGSVSAVNVGLLILAALR